MNKICILIIYFFSVTAFSNTTKKIIIALSLNDCISCIMPLNQLNSKLSNPEMTIVFPGDLEADSLLVSKKTGIANYKSGMVIYSDSLFNKYVNGIRSTINIIENNKKIYAADLYQLNVEEFVDIYTSTNSACFSNIKRGAQRIQDSDSMLVFDLQLFRWSYYDQSNAALDIMANEEWVKKAYAIYYDDQNVEKKYNEFETFAKKYPAVNPVIKDGKKINSNELLFLVEIYFLETDNKTQEELILRKLFLATYNIKERSIHSLKYINAESSLLKEEYYLNNMTFHPIENGFIIPLGTNEDPTAESKFLSVFEENKNNSNELILTKIIDKNIPYNYIKYKIYNHLHKYIFDKSLILLHFGEFIYDYKKDNQYKIPFSENEFNTLTDIVSIAGKTGKLPGYFIHDIADKGESILLLYKDSSKNLKLMEIDKKTEKVLKDVEFLSSEELGAYKYSSSFSLNENGEVVFLYNDNCIMKLNPKK